MIQFDTVDDARAMLNAKKKTKHQKILKDATLLELKWSDGVALEDEDVAKLCALLKNEGPGKQDGDARSLAAHLDPASADAWSNAVRAIWEQSTPAAQKWALFQQRVMANADSLAALATSKDWSAMASSGGSARARWYIEVFTDIPSSGAALALYKVLVDKFSGALHRNATDALERFAKLEGLDMSSYLEQVGVLGKMPDESLPFTPGVTKIDVAGEPWTVHLHQGAIRFVKDADGHRASELPSGADKATTGKIEEWTNEIARQSLRWGSFFLQLEDRSHTRTLAELEASVLAHPLGAQLSQTVVWRDGDGRTMRLTPEGAFDVEYDALEVSPEAALSIVLLGDLDAKASTAWTQHMVDEEIVMPVDILSRQLYVDLFKGLNDAEDVNTNDLRSRTHDQGFHHGPAEDAGLVYVDYYTFGDYNVRAWASHTGYSISDGQTYSKENFVRGMYFEDLFGATISPEKVHPPVLAEACIALAKMKGLPSPSLFS